MICPRCLNQEAKYFFRYQEKIICRRCIHLDGLLVDPSLDLGKLDPQLELPFQLSAAQQEVSQWLLRYGFSHNLLIHAVCGAGKTEMMLEFVQAALEKGLKVGWMIARRQVVLQLQRRLQKHFPQLKVIAVCQGHTQDLVGDLVLCTAHQLYRFPNYFDILIIDEPDAFPYVNDALLEGLARVSCKRNFIYLTATPDETLKRQVDKTIVVHRRPHQRALVVPKVFTFPKWLLYLLLLKLLKQSDEQWLVFLPSIALAKRLSKRLRLPVLTSQSSDGELRIERFSQGLDRILLTTTILERGVTFEAISVIVFLADAPLFDEAALIQISGRVGRSFNNPKGVCYFLCSQKSETVTSTIKTILQHNQAACFVSEI